MECRTFLAGRASTAAAPTAADAPATDAGSGSAGFLVIREPQVRQYSAKSLAPNGRRCWIGPQERLRWMGQEVRLISSRPEGGGDEHQSPDDCESKQQQRHVRSDPRLHAAYRERLGSGSRCSKPAIRGRHIDRHERRYGAGS